MMQAMHMLITAVQDAPVFAVIGTLACNTAGMQDTNRISCLQVAVRPTLVPLTVDAIPDSALPYANLSKLLSASEWDKLCRTTARAANYKCCPIPPQHANGH